MSMEKITKEELLEKIGGTPLSDDELEMVSGGNTESQKQCIAENNCNNINQWPLKKSCIMHCLNQ